jgi:8-oxo-dGTP pyrophosphatase MutT (NUDIX family)
MAPLKRQKVHVRELPETEFRRSSVILVLCTDPNGNLYIPLTERFAYDGVHSGQVSLPGGKHEDGDIDHTSTALRECFEEIGIEKGDIEVLGELTPLYIPVSKFLVRPVVGFCTIVNPDLRKNPREVKHIAKLYLSELMNENIVKTGAIMLRNDQKIEAPYFSVEDLKVWGATAMILSEFKTVLKTIF